MKAVFKILTDDVEEIRQYGAKNQNDFARRALLRTHFAFIEGMVFQFQLLAIAYQKDFPSAFSHQDVSILEEKKYQLKDNGQIEARDNFQKLPAKLLFSIKAYASTCGVDFKPDTSHHGWAAFKRYLSIRNDLMHPKSVENLILDNKKLTDATEAADWFKKTVLDLFSKTGA